MEGRWEVKGEEESDDLGEDKGNNEAGEKERERMKGKKGGDVEEERSDMLKRERGEEGREKEEKGGCQLERVAGEEEMGRWERKEQRWRGRCEKGEE